MMFDDRWFSDTYDLYRPTVATTTGGVQSVTVLGAATAEDQPCRLFPGPPTEARRGDTGLGVDIDAVLLVPAAADIRPDAPGQQPDQVVIGAATYVVLRVHDPAALSYYKRVWLAQLRS